MNVVVAIDHEWELTGVHRRWLLERGVKPEHIDAPFPLHTIGNDIGIDVVGIGGDLVDIVRWDIEAKRIDAIDGAAVAIGEGLLDLGDFPIPIWRSPCQWLRAGRSGIVPINWRGVAARILGRTLVASDQKERDEIAWRLGVSLSPIVVRADGIVCRPDRRMPSAEELQALSNAPGTGWHHINSRRARQ